MFYEFIWNYKKIMYNYINLYYVIEIYINLYSISKKKYMYEYLIHNKFL